MNAVESVLRVVSALDRLKIPYMVVGSFSSNVYGKPRSTKDADFVIELGHQSIGKLAQEIGADFVLDPQMSFESITSTRRHRLTHRDSAFIRHWTDQHGTRELFEKLLRAVQGLI